MRALSIYDDDFPTLVTENIVFVSVDVTASSEERIEYEQYEQQLSEFLSGRRK